MCRRCDPGREHPQYTAIRDRWRHNVSHEVRASGFRCLFCVKNIAELPGKALFFSRCEQVFPYGGGIERFIQKVNRCDGHRGEDTQGDQFFAVFHMIKLLSGVSRRGGIGSKRCVELIISEKRERYNAKIKGKRRKRDENKTQFDEKRRLFRLYYVMSTYDERYI